jgi:hypothetical protein
MKGNLLEVIDNVPSKFILVGNVVSEYIRITTPAGAKSQAVENVPVSEFMSEASGAPPAPFMSTCQESEFDVTSKVTRTPV